MNQPEPGNSAVTPVFVEDLFVTDVFLIKGRLHGKNKRLSNVLQDYERTFLTVRDATMVSLRTQEVIRVPSVKVNFEEVLFAQELLPFDGYEALRRLGATEKTSRIRAFYSGAVQFELSGKVDPGAYEPEPLTQRRFFIMQEPKVRGLDMEKAELEVLSGLDYLIVRKDRMSYVYDFA